MDRTQRFVVLFSAVLHVCLLPAAAMHSVSSLKGLAQRLLKDPDFFAKHREQRRQQHQNHRHLEGEKTDGKDNDRCDSALTDCLSSGHCLDCFVQLKTNDVDWASVSSGLECDDVLKTMYSSNLCTNLENQPDARGRFCKTFTACVDNQEAPSKNSDKKNDPDKVNCNKLERCEFPGFHEQFLGDGICNDKLPGCYNTAICGYDGGDCCEDSCQDNTYDKQDTAYCGLEPYVCKDPQSARCDTKLNPACEKEDGNEDDEMLDCEKEDANVYNLVMYDSFGDGWDETKIAIKEHASQSTVFEGELDFGAVGTKQICLQPLCYNVTARGGRWGKEVSWEVKPDKIGAPTLASGGSPMNCSFAVGGTACENTCTGKSDEDPTEDPDYKAFKEMMECFEKTCPIQLAACKEDSACNDCYEAEDLTPNYCFGMKNFNDLVDCSLCGCTDEGKMEFCMDRDEAGTGPDAPCTPTQTLAGGTAIIEFNECTNFDEIAMLMIEFDQDHFGDLDSFEACAHSFHQDRKSRTAMSCMAILSNAIDGNTQVETSDPIVSEAVSALADFLYNDGKEFCDCSEKANEACPICPSFHNFKTLLYESVDACKALDEIDCAAWGEFAPNCKENLNDKFKTTDFTDSSQCQFVHDGCGLNVPFPSFRRLDCDKEEGEDSLAKDVWEFYQRFSDRCLNGDAGPAPPSPTPPTPAAPVPSSPSESSNKKPYVPPEKRGDKKPYVPPESKPSPSPTMPTSDTSSNSTNTSPSEASKASKKKSHWLRNLFWLAVLGGGGYWYYKTWGTSLEGIAIFLGLVVRCFRSVVARIRGGRLSFTDGGGYGYDSTGSDTIYSGLAMESSTTFEPASLPPPPSAMGQDTNYYI